MAEVTPAAPSEIFRAYDIRGILERQLTPEIMQAIGRAIGSEAAARGDCRVMVGRDCRASSPALAKALIAGIRASGLDVVDLGVAPTPMVYFACCEAAPCAGAIVTASHNPPDYNGVKIVFGGVSADAATIQDLRRRILEGDLIRGSGGLIKRDISERYRERVVRDIRLARPMRLVLDCGNATVSGIAPAVFRALGCEVIALDCDPSAGMGERIPDPARPECLQALARRVIDEGADLGLGFDGDGDRLGVIDAAGGFIAADRLLMCFAVDILNRHPGSEIVFDLKCTGHLAEVIRRAGGRPVPWRSGHAPLKARLRGSDAQIAGELSGHIMLKERWYGFDDALYAGARLLEILSHDPRPTDAIFRTFPGGIATPELALPLPEGEAERIMARVIPLADRLPDRFGDLEVQTLDGLRLDSPTAWGLVRASNTLPKLVFRFEGDDPAALAAMQERFRRLMDEAAPGLALPF
ncbi:phosphomannomutase/phosphoglucomutase [Thiocapsa bogorovii]|uniref:phosphomannomutase/phosphoglucomutase n=1 Tax=Thiocapsa bogorovii TaxID=521689 RepID=UPI001E5D6408|nr:phosphomannomutase/phosphoglucomutase [Thiocapsa bogorovii]UHD14280.1 phosphomannomutase/phosphoglucomutase [Thiocapsa bogorovii]